MSKQEDIQHFNLFIYCFYFIIVVVGAGFLISGIYEAHHSVMLYQTGLLAHGKVQKVENKSNTDADWTTYEVAFVATDHRTYIVQNHYSTADDVKLYKVGQLVPVIYLPTDPEDGRIDNRREKSGVYRGGFLEALFAVIFGAVFYFFFHRPTLGAKGHRSIACREINVQKKR